MHYIWREQNGLAQTHGPGAGNAKVGGDNAPKSAGLARILAHGPTLMQCVRRGIGTGVLASGVAVLLAGTALAGPVWIQIATRPTLASATDLARAASGPVHRLVGDDLVGFRLGNDGAYALAIGPYADPDEANITMNKLQGEGAISADSHLTDNGIYGAIFWPDTPSQVTAEIARIRALEGADGAPSAPVARPQIPPQIAPPTPPVVAEGATTSPRPLPKMAISSAQTPPSAPVAGPALDPAAPPTGVSAQDAARDATLSVSDRRAIQSALLWSGHYTGTIDGSFGPATRRAIGAWQTAEGHSATGYLTQAEQQTLLTGAEAERKTLGLDLVDDKVAGIRIDLPMARLAPVRYDPPFAIYRANDGSGLTILLVSRDRDPGGLTSLYDSLSSLDLMPETGARSLTQDGFTLTGTDANRMAYAQASLANGMIKGFLISYPRDQDTAMAPVLAAMQSSFRPIGPAALDPGLGTPVTVERSALLAGTQPNRTERRVQSGLHIDTLGRVITIGEEIAQCPSPRIDGLAASVVAHDPQTGLVLLVPQTDTTTAPRRDVQFAALRSDADAVSVAGYSYGALAAPVLSAARVMARDANGATLSVRLKPGDVGGPVLAPTGTVAGMVQAQSSASGTAKMIPSATVNQFLIANGDPGQNAATPLNTTALSGKSLARRATLVTARVSCSD